MPTVTTGLFFLARQRPMAETLPDGTFRLTLHVRDKQAEHRVEPYVAVWAGNAAKSWWQEHGSRIQAGQPLALELHNPRCYVASRDIGPEIHAAVLRCELAPVAPSWIHRDLRDQLCAISHEARAAAKKFTDVNEACPYPFHTDAAKVFRQAFNAEAAAIKTEETKQ